MRGSAVFDSGALESNRAGRLSDDQLPGLQALARRSRTFGLLMGVACLVLAEALLATDLDVGALKLLGGAGLLLAAVFLSVRAGFSLDGLSRDLRDPVVVSIDGEVSAQKLHLISPTPANYFYLYIGGRRLQATEEQYRAVPDNVRVRLYYLSRSNRPVNWERLPDVPKQPAMPAAEVHALEQGILGRWTDGVITIEFLPGGHSTVELPRDRRIDGTWSIDSLGRLIADATGTNRPQNVLVSADELTLSEGASAKRFARLG
jgi:hypothetical protein